MRDGTAVLVALGVVDVHRLDVGDDGRAERRLAGPDRLQRDGAGGVDGSRRLLPDPVARAVDVQRVRGGVDLAAIEDDAPRLDGLHVAESHDVGDFAQPGQLDLREDRAAVHRRLDGLVDAHEAAELLELQVQIVDRRRLLDGPRLRGEVGEHAARELGAGLHGAAVQDPGLAGLDPGDLVWRDVVPQQPRDGVHRRLTRADDDVLVVRGLAHQAVGRDADDIGRDVVGGRSHRRHDDAQIGGVDDATTNGDAVLLAAERPKRVITEVFGHREVPHPARRQQVLPHHGVVVGDDLATACQFPESLVPAAGVDRVAAEPPRVHPVVRRGLMKPHVGVGGQPVAAGCVVAVDQHDRRVGLTDQGVDERHAHGAGAHNQIIGFDRLHPDRLARPLPSPTRRCELRDDELHALRIAHGRGQRPLRVVGGDHAAAEFLDEGG